MKLICFLLLNFILCSNTILAESLFSKSELIKKSNKCLKYSQNQICKNLILQLEKLQIISFEQNRLKCQSSILGLQTELIEAYYFKKLKKKSIGVMVPYVIKNC